MTPPTTDSHSDPADTEVVGDPLREFAELFGVTYATHRLAHDILHCLLNNASGVPELFGFDYAETRVLAVKNLPDGKGGVRDPDSTFHCSNTKGQSWDKAVAEAKALNTPLDVLDIETKTVARPQDDAEQLHDHGIGFRMQYTRMIRTFFRIYLTSESVPRKLELPVDGGNEAGITIAEYVPRSTLSADNAPPAMRECPFGAFFIMTLPGGHKQEHVLRALRAWCTGSRPDNTPVFGANMMFTIACAEYPEVSKGIMQAEPIIRKEQEMANGIYEQFPSPEFMDRLLEGRDYMQFPGIRRFIDEQQRQSDAQLREKDAQLREKDAQLQEKEQEQEQEKRDMAVSSLLSILRRRSIWLPESTVNALRQLSCSELPHSDVAFDAEDAEDFARRAGLK